MALVLSVGDWIELIEYPAPEDFPDADAWLDAFFGGESERGPQHGGEPAVGYGTLWALWLSTVPYGIWSEHVQGPSMDEHRQWIARLERELGHALEHFGLALREGTTLNDLAGAVASLIEGVWLNQCLTTRHPTRPVGADRDDAAALGPAAVAGRDDAATEPGDAAGRADRHARARARVRQPRLPARRARAASGAATPTRRWIACRLEFRGWHRSPLMQPGRFTELFFLDEATAFAAGHRPCALCRREDYDRFGELWPGPGGADAIDLKLHGERLRRTTTGGSPSCPTAPSSCTRASRGWCSATSCCAGRRAATPSARRARRAAATVITPPSLVAVLRGGWEGAVPLLHPSARILTA